MVRLQTRQRRQTGSEEAEALHTDVMRFLAIICMCLMIVFSLMQSLPVSDTDKKPAIWNKAMLEREIDVLEEKARSLRQVTITLENELVKNRIDLKSTVERVEEKRKQETGLDAAVRSKIRILEQKINEIERIRESTESVKKKFEYYKQMIRKTSNKLVVKHADSEKSPDPIEKGRRSLQQIEAKLIEAKNQIGDPEGRSTPIESKKKNEKTGFSLGFASNDALMDLLKDGRQVQLYMLFGQTYWKLDVPASGSLGFHPSPAPDRIYEMDLKTVPEPIIKVGRRTVATTGGRAHVYGVVLTPEITHRLKILMKERTGGDLIISSQGIVGVE